MIIAAWTVFNIKQALKDYEKVNALIDINDFKFKGTVLKVTDTQAYLDYSKNYRITIDLVESADKGKELVFNNLLYEGEIYTRILNREISVKARFYDGKEQVEDEIFKNRRFN